MRENIKFPLLKAVTLLTGTLAGLSAMSPASALPVTWNGWTFDYEVGVNNEGLALKNVSYQNHKLLKKISLPAINSGFAEIPRLPNDQYIQLNNCTPQFKDYIDSNLTAMPWANNATLSQRQFSKYGREWLELGVYKIQPLNPLDPTFNPAPREYFQAYYISNDGLFDAHLYSRGGWDCSTDERIPHWRVDFDVDGSAADLVETNNGTNLSFTARPTEFSASVKQGAYRVRDTVTNASASVTMAGLNFSHPDGVETQPTSETAKAFKYDNAGNPINYWSSSWTNSGLLYKSAEDAGLASTYENSFLNSENINNTDVVTWFDGVMTPLLDTFRPNLGSLASVWYTNSLFITPSWPQSLPDVVVDEVNYDGKGRYSVVVRNLGAITPADKSVGVGIFIDGVYKTYVSANILLPGAVSTLTSAELNRYVIQPGDHVITAKVDDVNRFAETHEDNNTLNKLVSITGPTVAITSPAKSATVSGATVLLAAVKTDPVGDRYWLNFYVDGKFIGFKWSSPYVMTWDSSTVAAGLHSLTILSTNIYGNEVGSGSSVVFNVVAGGNTARPDLAVTSLNYTNGQFTATIKNLGASSIPAGVPIGLSFYVDGKYKSWGRTDGPIAAGESRVLVNLAAYAMPSGTHAIKVLADDQNSVMEADESNNSLSKSVTVP